MEELLNKVIKLPLAIKAGALAGIVVLITGLNYWMFVSDTMSQIESQTRTLEQERDRLIERQAIANRLPEYRREMAEIERMLEEALEEMPAETRMDDLINQLAEIAGQAGLELSSIDPQPQFREDTFYYRIPVRMQVAGNFHEVAVFLDRVSKMRRLVNVTNIEIGSPRAEDDKVLIRAQYLATTFRFSEEASGGGDGDGAGRGR